MLFSTTVFFISILALNPCENNNKTYPANAILDCLKTRITIPELNSFIDDAVVYLENKPYVSEHPQTGVVEELRRIQNNINLYQSNGLDVLNDIAKIITNLRSCDASVSLPFVGNIAFFLPYCLVEFVEEEKKSAKLVPNLYGGVNWTKIYEKGGDAWNYSNLFDAVVSEIDYNGGGNSYLSVTEALEMVGNSTEGSVGCFGADSQFRTLTTGTLTTGSRCFFPGGASFVHRDFHSPDVYMKLKSGGGPATMPWLGTYLGTINATASESGFLLRDGINIVDRTTPSGMPDVLVLVIALAGLFVIFVIGLIIENCLCK